MAINNVFYLAWCGYGAAHYVRFLESFLSQSELKDVKLTIIYKGDKASFQATDVQAALTNVPNAHLVNLPDEGRDIDIYRTMLSSLQPDDIALFFNTRTVLRSQDALRFLFAAARNPDRPLVGCCGSYERLDKNDPYPNPHLRTNGFGGLASLLWSLDWSYTDRPHEVECGPNSLTRQAIAAGHACVIVNASGQLFRLSEWPLAQTWRNHGQRQLLIEDNRSDDFEQADESRRRYLRSLAWFPHDKSVATRKKKKKVERIVALKNAIKDAFRRRFSMRRRFGTRHFEGFAFETSDNIIETSIGAPVDWHRDNFSQKRRDDALNQSPSFTAWAEKVGGHKWLHYFEIYDREVLKNLPDKPRILEIGVYNGASARMWRDLSKNMTCYVGIDIDPRCAEYADPESNIHIEIGSQDDPVLLRQVIDQYGPFDLIIDDGSHESKHMIATFCTLFLNGLAPGGMYVVEDTHTNAWKPFNNGRPTFLQFAKRLTDYQNHHYFRRKFNFFRPDGRKVSKTPAVTVWLHSVKFFDSIVIVEKKVRDDGPPQVVHK